MTTRLHLRGAPAAHAHSTSHGPGLVVFGALFASAVFFSLTDLFTTAIALGRGLVESNFFILHLSSASGLGLLLTLELTKTVFLLGCAATCLIGARSTSRKVSLLALAVLSVSVVLQGAVSVSNVFSI